MNQLPINLKPGLHILSGKPKVGKTRLALQIAVQAACDRRQTLYWTGEDRQESVEGHLQSFSAPLHPVLDFFHVNTNHPYPVSLIHQWLIANSEAVFPGVGSGALIILEGRLPELCGPLGEGENAYARDYCVMSGLKALADQHSAAILLVRNALSEAAALSGSDGVQGACESYMILQGTPPHLHICSRDERDQNLFLEFDEEVCQWRTLPPQEEKAAA
ncbi:MAG TPA: hypothetical protein VGB77_13445 [Abditibacteriaceae bacterium]|jgi:hypothetical protein